MKFADIVKVLNEKIDQVPNISYEDDSRHRETAR